MIVRYNWESDLITSYYGGVFKRYEFEKRELIFSLTLERESPTRFRTLFSLRKKKKKEESHEHALGYSLPFEDHSATDRKGVLLDFTASLPLPAPLLVRGMPCSSYTSMTLLFPRVFLPFSSLCPYFTINLLSSTPLGLPWLGVSCEKNYTL